MAYTEISYEQCHYTIVYGDDKTWHWPLMLTARAIRREKLQSNKPTPNVLQAGCHSRRPTNSVRKKCNLTLVDSICTRFQVSCSFRLILCVLYTRLSIRYCIHQTTTAVQSTAVVMVTRKPRKKRWLDSPTHVSSHGQWWSNRRTHRPQSSQWRALSGCFTRRTQSPSEHGIQFKGHP